MFNRIMISIALLGMVLSVLFSTISDKTVEFNATNKSENVSTSVNNDESLPNSKESDNKSVEKKSNSIIDKLGNFCCALSLFSFLLIFLHNFVIDCLISYETKRKEVKQI